MWKKRKISVRTDRVLSKAQVTNRRESFTEIMSEYNIRVKRNC